MIMATINDKLTYIEGTKDAIKQAIIAKGVSVSDTDTFRSYASKINDIESGGGLTKLQKGTKFSNSTFTEAQMFDTSEITDMGKMFENCESLTTVPQFNTDNVTNMESMFENCRNLTTVPPFNTDNVTNMASMFSYCRKVTTVPQFNTDNVTSMNSMFYSCTSLTTVPQFNTANVTDMISMFGGCLSLTTVPQFNIANVTSMGAMFVSCQSLTTLGGLTGLKIDLNLSYSSKLTVDSVMNVITNAADMTTNPKTLTLHADVFKKLSQEQIATATAKGWNIASK